MASSFIIRGGFQKVYGLQFRTDTIRKAQELVQAAHVKFVEEYRSREGKIFIRGKCVPSMSISKDMYIIEFEIDPLT
jgi:hypothetical protein